MPHEVFISYSSKDKAVADKVCSSLEERGIPCWIAPRNVHPGSPYSEEIIDAIETCRVMVLVFSSNANTSPHIPKEIERAVSHGISVIPLRVEAVTPGKALDYFISSVHWLDAVTPPLEAHLDTLATTIQAVLANKPRPAGDAAPVSASRQVPAVPAATSTQQPAVVENKNKRIGDYEVLNELGSGGMGRVYRVRNVISDRIEAMKVLLPNLAGRQELAERFLREIKLTASLDHPNIAALRTAFTADNQLIMIMEFVEGTSLAALLEKGPIPPADAVNYIGQALDALQYAHDHHVIHRDIKPANMMLTPQGTVKLMDFGIARTGSEHNLTLTGTTIGSLGYMSPEQVKGEATDARSDIYSVGVSLYEMVSGQRPFRADSDYALMAAQVNDTPKPLGEIVRDVPPGLNEIISMAMAKDPAKRFQTAKAFRNALNTVKPPERVPLALHPGAAPTAGTVVPAAILQSSVQERTPAVTASVATPQAPAPSVLPPVTPMPLPPPPSHHRGLYMTLGALVVLASLVAAGIYVPRHTHAGSTAGANPSAPSASSQQPVEVQKSLESTSSTQAPPAPAETSPASGAQTTSAPAPHPQKLTARAHAQDGSAYPEGVTAASESQAVTGNAKELDQLENEIDQLTSRAGAVDSSLQRLQQQQAASGYGLRNDISSRLVSMRNNISKAQGAVQQGDVERARKYRDLAEGDVEALEHFLGR
jgi:serine/threonine-protein kinase